MQTRSSPEVNVVGESGICEVGQHSSSHERNVQTGKMVPDTAPTKNKTWPYTLTKIWNFKQVSIYGRGTSSLTVGVSSDHHFWCPKIQMAVHESLKIS